MFPPVEPPRDTPQWVDSFCRWDNRGSESTRPRPRLHGRRAEGAATGPRAGRPQTGSSYAQATHWAAFLLPSAWSTTGVRGSSSGDTSPWAVRRDVLQLESIKVPGWQGRVASHVPVSPGPWASRAPSSTQAPGPRWESRVQRRRRAREGSRGSPTGAGAPWSLEAQQATSGGELVFREHLRREAPSAFPGCR